MLFKRAFAQWTYELCDVGWVYVFRSQLSHSYYFTTRILVLKVVNKWVFFKKIQDLHFPRKVYFGTHLCEFGEKGLFFKLSVLPWKGGFIWVDKSVFYHKKGAHFGLKSQCFITKKGLFWAEKLVFCHKKGGHFQTREQGWVPFFPVSEVAGT